jgi:hypothetical protein
MKKMAMKTPLATLAMLTACACSGSGEGGGPVGAASGPLYVVFSTVDSAEERQGYFVTTPSLDGDVPIDVSKGLEEPGGGRLYAEDGIGTFMIGGGETPTITRYEVSADGAFLRGATISFANQGVANLADGAVTFISPSKAYLRDDGQLQLISFDPTKMEILDTIPLEGVTREGVVPGFGQTIKRSDGIYFPISYYNPENFGLVPEGSLLVRVVPETDEVTVNAEARCTGFNVGFLSEAGDAYWFSDVDTAVGWRANPPVPGAQHDCALRVPAGETTYDPTWQLDVNTRTHGWPAIAAVPDGGSRIWMRVLEESSIEVPTEVDPVTLAELPGWQWYLLDLEGTGAAVANHDRPAGSYYTYNFRIDGRTFTTESNADYSEARILEITDQGFREGPMVSGTVRGLARLR